MPVLPYYRRDHVDQEVRENVDMEERKEGVRARRQRVGVRERTRDITEQHSYLAEQERRHGPSAGAQGDESYKVDQEGAERRQRRQQQQRVEAGSRQLAAHAAQVSPVVTGHSLDTHWRTLTGRSLGTHRQLAAHAAQVSLGLRYRRVMARR